MCACTHAYFKNSGTLDILPLCLSHLMYRLLRLHYKQGFSVVVRFSYFYLGIHNYMMFPKQPRAFDASTVMAPGEEEAGCDRGRKVRRERQRGRGRMRNMLSKTTCAQWFGNANCNDQNMHSKYTINTHVRTINEN